MSSTPHGWKLLKLRDIATLKTGPFGSALHKADYTVGGIPLINPTHIKNGKLAPSIEVSVSPETAERLSDYQLNKDDIVMGRRGEMGRCAVVPEHAQNWLCGTGSVVVKSTFAAHPNYLQRFLTAPATVAALIGDSVGSTMINLNQGVLLGLDIPLAPLPEQKRIADKLDSVLARVDACRDRLDRLPALLKRFRQSILAAATSGQLTEDWRKTKKYQWDRRPIESIAEVIDPHPSHRTPPEVCDGVPYISIGDLNSQGEFDFDNARKVGPDVLKEHKARYKIEEGDFIFGKIGTIGKPTKLPLDREYTVSANVLLIKANNGIVYGDYLRLVFTSPNFMSSVMERSTATSQAAFGIKKMRTAEIQLPPLPEQTEIVRRVELLFAFADRLEARLASARQKVGQLTPALLAKAFRGELVPQDPADEPAAELLKRLAAQREAAPKARRGRASKA